MLNSNLGEVTLVTTEHRIPSEDMKSTELHGALHEKRLAELKEPKTFKSTEVSDWNNKEG
jgi:hypothetical protein